MRRLIWLQTPIIFWPGGGTIFHSYWIYMDLMILGRQKYTQQNHQCLSKVSLGLSWLLKAKKYTIHQVLFKSQRNWIKLGVEQFVLWSINLLILFGIRRNCLRSGKNWSLYLFISKVIKDIVVIIESYHFRQLHTHFYPACCCQG